MTQEEFALLVRLIDSSAAAILENQAEIMLALAAQRDVPIGTTTRLRQHAERTRQMLSDKAQSTSSPRSS